MEKRFSELFIVLDQINKKSFLTIFYMYVARHSIMNMNHSYDPNDGTFRTQGSLVSTAQKEPSWSL